MKGPKTFRAVPDSEPTKAKPLVEDHYNREERCDGCGQVMTGVMYPVYDENWNVVPGLKCCDKCA